MLLLTEEGEVAFSGSRSRNTGATSTTWLGNYKPYMGSATMHIGAVRENNRSMETLLTLFAK